MDINKVFLQKLINRRKKFYTFAFIPPNTNSIKMIHIPKLFTNSIIFCFFLSIGVSIPLVKEIYQNIQNSKTSNQATSLYLEENNKLKAELSELKNQLAQTAKKLQTTEKSLEKIQAYQSHIGPLSKNEYSLSQKLNLKAAVKPDILPISGGYMSSPFGMRSSPFDGYSRMHRGIDIAAPLGTPIKATADGLVTKVEKRSDYGIYIEIKHNHKLLTRYAHIRSAHVKVGQHVTKGTVIGSVGMTGRTTGAHLHYEVELNGQKIDPNKLISSR